MHHIEYICKKVSVYNAMLQVMLYSAVTNMRFEFYP